MQLSLRAVLIGLVCLVAAGGLLTVLPDSNEAVSTTGLSHEAKACEAGSGVTVVVDFGTSIDKPAVVRCARGFEGTGWSALTAAGVKVEGTAQFPVGFVCRLADWPEKQQQNCSDTPTYQEGHWAYFYADSRQSAGNASEWQISGIGASMRKPTCGSFEGWRFLLAGESTQSEKPRVVPTPTVCPAR
jgi:hypothetical protein